MSSTFPIIDGTVMTDHGPFIVGKVKLLKGEYCPACDQPKLWPRRSYENDVFFCVGCGSNFDCLSGEEIDPVEGPRAVVEMGEIVPPFTSKGRPWLAGLNAEQRDVALHAAGPLAVLAGAGTGKTKTLVARIRQILHKGTPAKRILAVTFSRKARDEMADRLEHVGVKEVNVYTWHGLAQYILLSDKTTPGQWLTEMRKGKLKPDAGKAKRILHAALNDRGNWPEIDLGGFLRFLTRARANLWTPDDKALHRAAVEAFGSHAPRAVVTLRWYEELTAHEHAMPYDDWLVHTVRHLADPTVRARWSGMWDHVLQDEAQDVNIAQATIARALTEGHRNYMVVGDPQQAIYGFRATSPETLHGFTREWDDAKVVHLMRNYRSGRAIVNLANDVIRSSAYALAEELHAEVDHDGDVVVRAMQSANDESEQVATAILEVLGEGLIPKHLAVLYRLNAQAGLLEAALRTRDIPYVIAGENGRSFYDQREVLVVLGYLRVALGCGTPKDFERCINEPKRALGSAFVGRVYAAKTRGISWIEAVREVAFTVGPRTAESAQAWSGTIAAITAQTDAFVAIEALFANTRYLEILEAQEDQEDADNSPAANLRSLLEVARRFSSTASFVTFAEEAAKAEAERRKKGADAVQLSTVHRAKGLEWPRVWVLGCNDGTFPFRKGEPDEEQRIFYVATTRAKDSLELSYILPGEDNRLAPSPFLVKAGLVEGSLTSEVA